MKVIIGADISQLQSEMAKAGGVTQSYAQKATAANTQVGASFQKLSGSVKNLTSSLISGGLTTAILAVGVALYEVGKDMFDLSVEQKRLTDVLEGGRSAYVKAVLEVDKLKDSFDKAKVGIISKKEALNLYNSTIGKTIGQTNDFNVAEQNLINQAPNYIKYTLLKAAANTALSKASEAAFKVEQSRIQGISGTEIGFGQGALLAIKQQLFGINATAVLKKAEQLQQKKINDNLKEQNDYLKIYNSLNEQAKALGFGEIEQLEVATKAIKEKTKALKEEKDVRSSLQVQRSDGVGLFGAASDLSRATGSTLTPEIVIKPEFKVDEDAQRRVFETMEEWLKRMDLKAFQEKAQEAIGATLNNIIVGIVDSTADAVAEALSGGKDVVPRLFDNIIKGIGQQIKELGKYLVEIGIKKLAIDKAIKALGLNPAATIVVGFAAQILGQLLINAAQKKSNNIGQGFASGTTGVSRGGFYDVGERGPERIFLPTGSRVQPNNELNAYGGGNQVFIPAVTLSGPDLVIAFNRASAMMGRNG